MSWQVRGISVIELVAFGSLDMEGIYKKILKTELKMTFAVWSLRTGYGSHTIN